MSGFFNRIYRTIFCRGGYGVHSPFVFELITNVIEERKYYYCYMQLQTVRLQILQRKDEIMVGHRKRTIKKALKKYGYTESEHRLLFRLTNRFQPKNIYVVGSDFGLTPLYLTAYSTNSACIAVEPDSTTASIAKEYVNKYATASIDVLTSINEIPDSLDFIVCGAFPEKYTFSVQTFESYLPRIHERSMIVIAGINASSSNRKVWKAICAHPKVTVTIDLYRLGIVFFNPKLHRQTYKSIATT